MWMRIGWIVLACFLLLPSKAKAQAPATVCDETWFKKPKDKTGLALGDLIAICDERNAKPFQDAMSVCPAKKDSCVAARSTACPALSGANLGELAQCFHAAGAPQLVRAPAPAPAPVAPGATGAGNVQAEGVAAAGAVSIIAQGASDFLIQRAQQEVSLYAATELQKALCKKYGDAYFPKSCKLLKEADDGDDPVGLGVLHRAVVEDLQALPAHVVANVLDRLDENQKKKACVLDVGYAFAAGVLTEEKVAPLFNFDPPGGDRLRLEAYRIKIWDKVARAWKPIDACNPTWEAVSDAAKKLQAVRQRFENATMKTNLASARDIVKAGGGPGPNVLDTSQLAMLELWNELAAALNEVLQGHAPKEASARAIRAGVALLKELLPAHDPAVFDETGAIALAVVDKDWIGVVAAVASAEHLGPVLLCKKDAKPCALDTKARATLRLVGDVAAADSSEGVTAALERFAAPLGTWRRKYQDGWYLMANGYVGAKLAYEGVKDARAGTTLAPVLAVGLEVGRNVGDLARIGLFAQVFDLGNVSSVRLSEKNDPDLVHVETAPDVTAAQLLAPGIFLTIAPWKAPFAVSLGADWVPELRTAGGKQQPAWHVGGALVVDTPILELYHE